MKDEDSTKVKIETKIDFTILDNENLQIVTSHQSAFNDIVSARQVEVMRLKDEGIRKALVKLGWTPPGMAPSIHEDNVRTLQEIIDDLRVILGAADGERITDAARRAATKQPAQATQAEVTPEEVVRAAKEATAPEWQDVVDGWHMGLDLMKFTSLILALRPVQEPMTREQAMVIVQSNPDTMTAIRMAEVHHGITAASGEVHHG